MRPIARVDNFLETANLQDARALREQLIRLIVEAQNAALLRASIELENNYFTRFTQAEAAHVVRGMMLNPQAVV